MNISSFIHKKLYEKLVRTVRRHPVTFIPYLLMFAVLCIIPVGLTWMIKINYPDILIHEIYFPLGVLLFSTYYLSICLFFYSYFVAFYLDMWVITNDRMVDIRQITLFARSVAELDLYQIQDATSEVKGVFPSLFDYGNVAIQTAGAHAQFMLLNVPHPHQLREMILDLAAEDKKYHNTVHSQ